MITKILVNLFLYVVCFVAIFIYRRGLDLNPLYLSYFAYYISAWGIAALVSRKFKQREIREFLPNLYPYLVSFILMMGILTGFTTLYKFYDISNYIILSSLLSAFLIEISYILYINGFELGIGRKRRLIVSYKVLLVDFVILIWVMSFAAAFHSKLNYQIDDKFILMMIGIVLFWIVSGIFSHQFPPFETKTDYWRYIWSYIKAYTIFMALVSFTMLQLRFPLDVYSHIFFGAVIYTIWSFIAVNIGYISFRPRKSDEVKISILKAQTLVDEDDSVYEVTPNELYSLPDSNVSNQQLKAKLARVYLKHFGELFVFLDKTLQLNSFDVMQSVILRSRDIYNVDVLPAKYLHFFLNLHEINDLRRINAYFIEVNKRLVNGGVYIGRLEPIKFRYNRFLKKYPFYFGQFFYFIDFMWRRVTPKLPILTKIYFALTQGKNRALSLAEGLGRLYYCGFEIVGTTEIDDFIYFAARKVKEPLTDTNPSYGPLFKMKRVGKDGKFIYVYKMRTMHPYSEYLQKYVYEKNSLDAGGKIKDDFRISNWGKVFRKLWIDELPMLINLLKGDLKLVGVRPLSAHYMTLYTEELRTKRIKTKPGLVPPFYVDMPKTLDEIINSELKYLTEYEKSPLLTDIKYFFLSFYNIIIKKARSA
jgi:lipopolysaccharide/colanic/teichoic acid biosynthesis glycosyltransferase